MKDYNFFKDHRKNKKSSDPGVVIAGIIMLTVVIGIGAIYVTNLYRLEATRNRLIELENQILEIKVNDEYIKVIQKQELLGDLEEIATQVENARNELNDDEIIDENIFLVITDTLPKDVELSSINLNEQGISITGISSSRPAIAEFQYNIVSSDIFADMHIPTITGSAELGVFSFSGHITLEGGVIDEN